MKKTTILKLITTTTLTLGLFVSTVSAANLQYKMMTEGGFDMYNNSTGESIFTIDDVSLSESFQYMFNFIVGASIAIAVVLLAFGGIAKALEAFGVKDAKTKAYKPDLLNPIVGLIIVLSSVIIMRTLNSDLLIFPLFGQGSLSGGAVQGSSTTGGSGATIDSVGPVPTSDSAPLYAPGA